MCLCEIFVLNVKSVPRAAKIQQVDSTLKIKENIENVKPWEFLSSFFS